MRSVDQQLLRGVLSAVALFVWEYSVSLLYILANVRIQHIRCQSPNVFTCLPASLYCNRELIGPYQQTGKNPYDVRKDCEDNNLCYKGLSAIQTYLNRDDVK